ncbi:MAG: peptidylprolyl isomerase [Pseudolabrys sp.]|nr:peptidylprolyl isomerase [Pseudolabrys sp.]MDP2298815.1 peptidylprolyl isomerase [Pseudolabrys sp.]
MMMKPLPVRNWIASAQYILACATIAAGLTMAAPASAQVVVIANGSPITELDIAQRTKLMATAGNKNVNRQTVIQELIDDRLKIAKARSFGLEVSETDVENAFQTMASRQRISPQQFAQMLERSGISPNALKARIRAEMTWSQMVRSRYGSSLQVGDADVADALKSRNESGSAVSYVYTLYPVTVVVPSGSNAGAIDAKRQVAENLRSRFTSCSSGLPLARALRDVAVREPITRNSAELPEPFRDLLAKLEVGRLSSPDVTAQGLQMFALCDKKESTADSPAKREIREKLFTSRYEAESKKFLDEIRRSAMIEYR